MALERLTPVEALPLTQASEQATRLRIDDRGRQRDGTITGQSLDGKVYVQFDDETIEHCYDLATAKYHWL